VKGGLASWLHVGGEWAIAWHGNCRQGCEVGAGRGRCGDALQVQVPCGLRLLLGMRSLLGMLPTCL
jgi:hypothetical protein